MEITDEIGAESAVPTLSEVLVYEQDDDCHVLSPQRLFGGQRGYSAGVRLLARQVEPLPRGAGDHPGDSGPVQRGVCADQP